MAKFAPTNAYIAAVELATVWRRFQADNVAFWEAARAWEAAHPDSPKLFISHNSYGFGFILRGFVKPEGEIPSGLRRHKSLLSPYKGKRGEKWAELLKTAPTPPSIDRTMHDFGIRDQDIPSGRDGTFYMVWPTLTDLDGTVYVTTAAEHPECEYLKPIPLSQYYAAREAAEAAAGDES